LTAGTPVGFDIENEKIHTLFYSWYNGMEGGRAFAEVLFGDINPSGSLPFTIAETLRSYPAHKSIKTYPGLSGTVEYSESIFNGYRFFLSKRDSVVFPFGYGLSYTDFIYSELKISMPEEKGDFIKVFVKVKNNGSVPGKTTVQIYIKDSVSSLVRPEKELKGFQKVYLEAGETGIVEISLDQDAFKFYSPEKGWIAEPGEFVIYAGKHAFDDNLSQAVQINNFSSIKMGIN
jgi:beta-glucosidase